MTEKTKRKREPCPACNTAFAQVRTSEKLNDVYCLTPEQSTAWGLVMGHWIWFRNTHDTQAAKLACCQKTIDLFDSLDRSIRAMDLEEAEKLVKEIIGKAEQELMKGREGNC